MQSLRDRLVVVADVETEHAVVITQVPHRHVSRDWSGCLELVSKGYCFSDMLWVGDSHPVRPGPGMGGHLVAGMSDGDAVEACLPGDHSTNEPGIKRIVIRGDSEVILTA